jgi:rhodanese-related sulfurtransferase
MDDAAPETPEKFLLEPQGLAERLKRGEKTELLDVRSDPEYRLLHIEGARPANRKLVDELFNSWPKDTPIVLCDHFGPRALDAARVLTMRGFTDVKALRGGLDAWSQEVDPLVPRYS